jgi:hypothetical protein
MPAATMPTPAILSQADTSRRRAAARLRAETELRVLAARRRETARNGYRGPLTRAELAEQASR